MPATMDLIGKDWHLVTIDGQAFEATATLRIEVGGTLSGKAPCNRWSAVNRTTLPRLDLGAIRSTRMACPRMAEETAFLSALAAMTEARLDREGHLILTGYDGRTMGFAAALTG